MDGISGQPNNYSSSNKRGSPITPRREPPPPPSFSSSNIYNSIGNSLHGLKLANSNNIAIVTNNRNILHVDGAHETRLMSFEINWIIEHYAFMKNWKNAITSPPILIADSADPDDGMSSWKIIFEPAKRSRHPERDQEEEWIALHVRRDEVLGKMRKNNEPSFVFARFLLTLIGPDGSEIQRRDTSEAVCFGPTENAQASRSSRQWGWERYVRQDSALKAVTNTFTTASSADNDHVKIYCELHVAIPSAQPGTWKQKRMLDLPQPIFFSNLTGMRESGEHCDVALISSDGQSFPVHRFIMAAVSEPLSVMFGVAGNFKERTVKEVPLPMTHSSMLKLLIEYAYSGEQVDFILCAAEDAVDMHTVRELLKSADQYGMLRLKAACENRLCETYNVLLSMPPPQAGLHAPGAAVACLDSDELIKELEFADVYSTETYRSCLCQYAARQPTLAAASLWYFSHQRQNFLANSNNGNNTIPNTPNNSVMSHNHGVHNHHSGGSSSSCSGDSSGGLNASG